METHANSKDVEAIHSASWQLPLLGKKDNSSLEEALTQTHAHTAPWQPLTCGCLSIAEHTAMVPIHARQHDVADHGVEDVLVQRVRMEQVIVVVGAHGRRIVLACEEEKLVMEGLVD